VAVFGLHPALDQGVQLAGRVAAALVLIRQVAALHLKDADQLVLQTAENVFLAPKPGVSQDIQGGEARPQSSPEQVPEQLVLGLRLGAAQVSGGRTALVAEGFVFGFVDGALFPQDDLGLHRQESLFSGQSQLQHLVSLAVAALRRVVVATGAFDLAARSGLAGVIDHKGALGAWTQFVVLIAQYPLLPPGMRRKPLQFLACWLSHVFSLVTGNQPLTDSNLARYTICWLFGQ